MLTTKKEEAPAPNSSDAAQDSSTPSLYSTKPTQAPAAVVIAKPSAPDPEDDINAPTITTKPPVVSPPVVAEKKDEVVKADATKPAVPEKPPEPAASSHKPGESLVVTAQRTAAGTVINFPWNERTAAAVFERSRDIWIVFSRPADVRVPLLRTVLPKPVVDITQYNYPNNTVLRIVTDGTLHASSALAKGSYDWNIILSTALAVPVTDVSMKTDTTYGIRQLLLGAFDVSPSLRFYDPNVGDLLVIIPSYEGGRGVSHERNFPEFTILNSGQGITIASSRPDITVQSSRVGVAVYAEGGLQISENLPTVAENAVPVPGMTAPSDVMLPYEQWYVPQERWFEERQKRLDAVSNASRDATPDSLMALATLYLGDGRGVEAHGYLSIIEDQFPDYYKTHRLALLHAAAYFMFDHIAEAAQELSAQELIGLPEADLWKEVIALYTPPPSTTQQIQQAVEDQNASPIPVPVPPPPSMMDKKAPLKLSVAPTSNAPKSEFHFLKYNRLYIRYYPPRIRQRLAVVAADAYIQNGNEDKALAVFDTLNHDNIIGTLRPEAEYALSLIAISKKQFDSAKDILDKLIKQNDNLYIQCRARYTSAILRYNRGEATADETTNILENIRFSWRGDQLEYKILTSLAQIYQDTKQYDNLLRTWKAMLDGFPNNPDTLTISGDMGQLFKSLYLQGMADSMPPLKSLSLFYEFRELTPVGPEGDEIIRRLADRLASFDLLDRATQLLEHQIKFRITNEERSHVGARLALLHLLNHQPKEALDVLQVTNYGGNPPDLEIQRQQLAAEALTTLGKHEQALSTLANDTTHPGALLRLDILWTMQDWPNVVNRAEDLLAERRNLTSPLTQEETEILLKLAIGYSFEGDNRQLRRYLRDYYSGLIPDTAYKQIFDFITNDTNPLDPADINMLTQQISHTEGFLSTFKSKIAEGKLSEAIK